MNCYFNLVDYFYDVVRKNNENIALRYENENVTYDELNKLSNKIANYFLSVGIRKYDVVGIFNTKTPIGYASMLAALKIGATYSNIDEENPLNRLNKILQTCKPKILISDHLINLKQKIVNLGDNKIYADFSDVDLDIFKNIISSTPAYIMFTSGSTGIPKGVLISHGNILSFIAWSIERFSVNTHDRFAQVSPLYFDNSVFDFYTALFSGACLVPIDKQTSKNPRKLTEHVDRQQCTIWFSVPSLLVYLLTMRVLREDNMKSIRSFVFGGEGFPKGELKKLYELYSKRSSLVNVYGPTEGTCICSSHNITQTDFEDMSKLAPLGPINPNFEYLVADRELHDVEAGKKGELYLIGPNISLGYYNDLERTNSSFIQNPKIHTHVDIIYKTGDLVYERDGLLWFAGRIDNQIKHMGYRIELEEVESALNGLNYISQSAVLYERVNDNYGKIVAYVASNSKITESRIKEDLHSLIPEYMIPNIVDIRGELPKNANGKINKKLLNNKLK